MADSPQRPRPPPSRRRDKVQLSCDPCRHRKLRCDRQQPCGACSRRGLTSSCNYATPSASSTPDARQPAAQRQATSLPDRIAELESLVVTLMKGHSLPSPPTPASPTTSSLTPARVPSEIRRPRRSQDEAASPADPGTLKLRDSGTSYVQSVHWEAVLTKIRGLKEDFVTGSKARSGSHLFYGPNCHATRDEILAAVPPRPVVDRLMALHFDSYIITPYLIHGKKFLREYESFWDDPSTTSIAWIGLMFSMLYIAAQLQTFTIDTNDGRVELLKAEYLTMKDAFREKAVQCLLLARYTTGGPHILETLIMVLTGEFVLLKDGATDGWLLMGNILHIAMRMGYHRDPDHFPGISPFEGEMRRRIWTSILQLDLVLSLEMGLPRSATDTHIDTKPPRNLRDCDFDEDTTEMPPPRPETEWTPVLPLIARGRLISALGLICDINTDIKPPSHDEVARIDALLEDVHSRAIPPVLRWDTASHPITDSPNIVVQRVSVETTYHKSRILLYRGALLHYPPTARPRDRASVRICLDSALQILSFQQMLHEESQPLGRLCQLRWKVTRIFNLDVLLATSVLCLYFQDVDKFEVPQTAGQATCPPRSEEVRQQLTISHRIWLQMRAASPEAGKVARALSIVLGVPETSADDGSELDCFHFPADLETAPLYEFGATFNSQNSPFGFYSPLTFFENVLGDRGE
ncbi:putative Zn(II)2Cys6 transcription factor [Xylariaceae sp. FL0016]|nr:putative Zn(II)2Cys6 transcription factor [Xylariaceae sp. FL0016]